GGRGVGRRGRLEREVGPVRGEGRVGGEHHQIGRFAVPGHLVDRAEQVARRGGRPVRDGGELRVLLRDVLRHLYGRQAGHHHGRRDDPTPRAPGRGGH